jgi:LPS sulfotransferase NodH
MLTTRRRRRRFVILFPGRAGGTFLGTGLAEHPAVTVKTEPLGMLARQSTDQQVRWIHRYLRGPLVSRAEAVGFTTKIDDIARPDALADDMRAVTARVILLDRSNEVKQAISAIRSRRLNEVTGHWNRRSPDHRLGSIEVDPEDFATRLARGRERRLATRAFALSLDLPLLELDYRDLLSTPATTFRRVFEHIGVAPHPVVGSTFKLTNDDLRESVSNFDTLRSGYADTEYEAMFDEVPQT